jgi:DNA polymerase-3 subunit delta
MKNLNADLKSGQFQRMYLLYGAEAYLKRQYKERFQKAMLPEGDTMNLSVYEGANVSISDAIAMAQTLPFFADRRLLIFEDTGLFQSKGAELAEALADLPDTTYLIFLEEEVDKRSKLYKTVQSKGYVAELAYQDEATLKKWILSLVRKEQKQIAESTVRVILEKVGTDMGTIHTELEKLFCYTLEKDCILTEDVEAVCVTQLSNHIFDMVHAVAMRQQEKALALYYELLALKEPPMRILFLLVRQYRILYQVKELQKKGMGRAEMAKAIGVPPFSMTKYLEEGKSYTTKQLRAILEDAAQMEEWVKTGRFTDRMAVELFLVEQSSERPRA